MKTSSSPLGLVRRPRTWSWDLRPLRGRVVSLMAANCTVLVTCLATFEQGGKYGSQIIRSRSIVRHPVDQLAEVVSMISQGVHVI